MMTPTVQDLIARLSELQLDELAMVIEIAQDIMENMTPDEYDERPLKPEIAEQLREFAEGRSKTYTLAEVRKNLGLDE